MDKYTGLIDSLRSPVALMNMLRSPSDNTLRNAAYAIVELQAKLEELQNYVRHKKDCDALKTYHIPACPDCGSPNTRWRAGVGFEGTKRCLDCHAHSWVPKLIAGKCSCGLAEIILSEQEAPDGQS